MKYQVMLEGRSFSRIIEQALHVSKWKQKYTIFKFIFIKLYIKVTIKFSYTGGPVLNLSHRIIDSFLRILNNSLIKTLVNPLNIYFIPRGKLSIILDFSVWLRTGFNPAIMDRILRAITDFKDAFKDGKLYITGQVPARNTNGKKLSNSRKNGRKI